MKFIVHFKQPYRSKLINITVKSDSISGVAELARKKLPADMKAKGFTVCKITQLNTEIENHD